MNTLQTVCTAFLVTAGGCGKISNVGTLEGNYKTYRQVVECIEYSILESIQDSIMNVDTTQEIINENELIQDTLQLTHYSFSNKTTPEAKKIITHILVNFKLGKLKSKVAEDGSALIFCENGTEQFILFPNIEYGFDDHNNPIMISKIADINRDEVIIALSMDKISNANITHCLYDWYTGSENYLTQLSKYSTRDIENFLQQLRGGCSVTPK